MSEGRGGEGRGGEGGGSYHFIVVSDGFRLLQPLEPHHVLCVEAP